MPNTMRQCIRLVRPGTDGFHRCYNVFEDRANKEYCGSSCRAAASAQRKYRDDNFMPPWLIPMNCFERHEADNREEE